MKKITALLLVALMLLSFTACDSSDYKKAVSLMESGDYASAAEMFEALGDYKDSADQLNECNYALAVAAFDSGDYDSAAVAFEALGDYEDSLTYRTRAELIGEWTAEEDISAQLMESILEEMGDTEGFELELKDLVCTYILTFTDKGTVTYVIDEDSYREVLNTTIDQVVDAMYAYYETEIEKELADNGYTMEQLYAEMGVDNTNDALDAILGMTVRELMETIIPVDELVAADTVAQNGVYTVENDAITITMGTEDVAATLADGELTVSIDDSPVAFTKG